MERDLYPIPEAAYRLGIGKAYMYQLAAAGEIKTVKLGRRKLIPATELDAYIERLKTAGA